MELGRCSDGVGLMSAPLSLQVITLHADGVNIDSDKRYNWNDRLDRARLTKHLHWAFHNSRRVAIEPLV